MTKTQIKVVLAINNEVVRSSMRLYLGSSSYLHVVGEAREGSEILTLCDRTQPDLILMDINTRSRSDIERIGIIRDQFQQIYVLAFSSLGGNNIQKILNAGADDFLLKFTSIGDLENIIRYSVERNGKSFRTHTEDQGSIWS